MMPISEFRREILERNLDEFRSDYASLCKAFNAIAAVDSYAAHIFYAASADQQDWRHKLDVGRVNFGNDVEFRQEISKKHRYFGLLRDLAKAIKHARLEQGKPGIRDSGALTSRGIAWGEAGFGCGRFGGVKQVVVTDNDGSLHFVESLVHNSVTLLDGYAVQLGLIDRPSTVQD